MRQYSERIKRSRPSQPYIFMDDEFGLQPRDPESPDAGCDVKGDFYGSTVVIVAVMIGVLAGETVEK